MNLTRYNDGVEQIIDTVRNLGFVDMADTWARDYAPIVNAHNIRIAFIGEFNHGKSSIINTRSFGPRKSLDTMTWFTFL